MDGLWTANFVALKPSSTPGGGVVVFNKNEVFGGDAGYYYRGQVETKNDQMLSRVRVIPFIPSAASVFGTVGQEFTLVLNGKRSGDVVEGEGYPLEMPTEKFRFRLRKVA